MHVRSIKCPECNSSLNINIQEGQHECYCQYCGAKITLDDHISNHIYRKVDEARIKEAEYKKEVRVRQAELDKEIKLKELEVESQKAKSNTTRVVVKMIAFVVLVVVAALFDFIGNMTYTFRDLADEASLMLFMTPIVLVFLFFSEKK